MEIAPMTKRDKILLYVVLMLAFVVLFVRFLLIPGIENHQQADADLRAQTSMQDAIMLADTYAAEKNSNWGELQTANANYYSLLSSDELDTLVTSLELNHNLQPESLTIGEPVTQSLTYYTASENAVQSAAPSAAASVFAGDDDSDDDSITADTADTTAQGNAILQQILASDLIPDYDQPGYYRSVAISFCCTGEDSDFLSMLDDMAANYPSERDPL